MQKWLAVMHVCAVYKQNETNRIKDFEANYKELITAIYGSISLWY